VRLFSRLNLACAVLGAAILLFVTMIIFMEVVLRAITGSSQLWVIEVSEYSLLYITFLGAPYLLEKNRHVLLDLVYNSLQGGARRVVGIINAAIGLALCGVLTVVGILVVIDQIGSGVRETTVMAPPSFWLTMALPWGMFLMSFQFLDQGVRAVTGRIDG
jgi:TRAP-type C4-dicarboxylate transport system permease small subunit